MAQVTGSSDIPGIRNDEAAALIKLAEGRTPQREIGKYHKSRILSQPWGELYMTFLRATARQGFKATSSVRILFGIAPW